MPAPTINARRVMGSFVRRDSYRQNSSFNIESITVAHMSSLDLNLFLVFLAVIEEGSTVAAARRLALSQSAISNALGRLRHALGDPLFVRRGRGLVPTPRAEALRPVVSEALGRLAGVLHERFTAASSTRTFTLACADHHQAADVPRVAAAFARRMPSACLRVVSVDYLLATDGLASGAVDAALRACTCARAIRRRGGGASISRPCPSSATSTCTSPWAARAT